MVTQQHTFFSLKDIRVQKKIPDVLTGHKLKRFCPNQQIQSSSQISFGIRFLESSCLILSLHNKKLLKLFDLQVF